MNENNGTGYDSDDWAMCQHNEDVPQRLLTIASKNCTFECLNNSCLLEARISIAIYTKEDGMKILSMCVGIILSLICANAQAMHTKGWKKTFTTSKGTFTLVRNMGICAKKVIKKTPEIVYKQIQRDRLYYRAPIMITPCEMIQLPNKSWIRGFPHEGTLDTILERSGRVFLFFSPRFRISGKIMEWSGKRLASVKNPIPKKGCIKVDQKSTEGFRVDVPCSDSIFAGHVKFANGSWKYTRLPTPKAVPIKLKKGRCVIDKNCKVGEKCQFSRFHSQGWCVKKSAWKDHCACPASKPASRPARAKQKPTKALLGERCWKRQCVKNLICLATPNGTRCVEPKLHKQAFRHIPWLKTSKTWCKHIRQVMHSTLILVGKQALGGHVPHKMSAKLQVSRLLQFSNQIGCQKPYPYQK